MSLLAWLILATFLFAVFYFLTIVYRVFFGSNYLPSPKEAIAHAMQKVKAGDTVIDLGFGNGEVLEAALLAKAGVVIGYELDLYRLIPVWIRSWQWKYHDRLQLRFSDIWLANLKHADVVYTFMAPGQMQRLYQKVKREMKPGTWFIAYKHPVPDVKPTKQKGELRFYRV